MRSRLSLPSALAATACVLAGCGVDFDPSSQLDGLRVLAVKKSRPYVRPGDDVELQMLWHDTEPGRTTPPQIAWAAFCQNPPGDLFEQCFAAAPPSPESNAERVSLPSAAAPGGANDRFAFRTAPDLISSRPPPKDPATLAYGLEYVFFAACAGELGLRSDGGFPFSCHLELDGEPGLGEGDTQLESRDFVAGYSSVFAYAELENQNPIVTGFELDGRALVPEGAPEPPGAGEVLRLAPPDLCIGAECTPPPANDSEVPCSDVLTLPRCDGDCPERPLRPFVDPQSAETDSAASAGRAEVLGEQMWVNYYVAGGEVDDDVRLLNDATLGWNEDNGTRYRAPSAPGISYLWAVAHDNRGGAEWARIRLCIL